MKFNRIKFFSFLVILSTLFCVFSVFALAEPADSLNIDASLADAVYLYNLNTSKAVYSKESTKKIFPGSTVKMMMGLVACEMLTNRLDEVIVIRDEMLEGNTGANVKLKSGMSVTVENLLCGVLCGGGNDASLVLAYVCAGSVDGFVDTMNKKAQALGMRNTLYTNPTGLDDENMYSTVSDTVVLARHAAQNKLYVDISSKANYEFTPLGESDSIKIYNRNSMISNFYAYGYTNPNAQGLIAGNTDLGGYCVVTLVEKRGTQYICAVMGAERDEDTIYAYKIANDLISYALNDLIYTKIAEAGSYVCDSPVRFVTPGTDTDLSTVRCIIKDDVYALTDSDFSDNEKLQYRYYLHSDALDAPVSAGVIVGGVDILYDGEYVGSAMLVAESDVEANGMLIFLKSMKSLFTSLSFWCSVISFSAMLTVYLYLSNVRNRRKIERKLSRRRR
ncbi:MAG: D-alanyl-D-alanine carboxypeptidase [Ruminococcaceae bacterium]|nr:D-alanyl-D-alanine carboxypeptidase [Oscillospiraceae bacterium]